MSGFPLLQLPDCLSKDILAEWCGLKTLIRVDTAVTSHAERHSLLDLYPGLRANAEDYANSWKARPDLLFNWLGARGTTIEDLDVFVLREIPVSELETAGYAPMAAIKDIIYTVYSSNEYAENIFRACIERATSLEHLKLHNELPGPISNDLLAAIGSRGLHMRSLSICIWRADTEPVVDLGPLFAGCQALEDLYLARSPLTEACAVHLSSNLRILELVGLDKPRSGSQVLTEEAALLVVIQRCPLLEVLRVDEGTVEESLDYDALFTNRVITAIGANLPHLQELSVAVSEHRCSWSTLTPIIQGCRQLRTLRFHPSDNLDDDQFIAVLGLPLIEHVSLGMSAPFIAPRIQSVTCPHLKSLHLSQVAFKDAALLSIAHGSPNLTTITLHECNYVTTDAVLGLAAHKEAWKALTFVRCEEIDRTVLMEALKVSGKSLSDLHIVLSNC